MNTRSLLILCGLSVFAPLRCNSDSPTPTNANDASTTLDGSATASGADYCRLESCVRTECPVPPGSAWVQCNVDLAVQSNTCRTATPSATEVALCTCGFARVSAACQTLFRERAACLVAHCP